MVLAYLKWKTFPSGDGCPFQDRHIDIKKQPDWRRKMLRWIIQQKDVCENERILFQLYNVIRRLQSWLNATLVMGKVTRANDRIPTREDIENNKKLRSDTASNLLMYKANIIDSKEYWFSKRREMIGGELLLV